MAQIFRQSIHAAVLAISMLLLIARPVAAEALVEVELRDAGGKPADGDVALVDAKGVVKASCTTSGGKCQMNGVAGGFYSVKVVPKQGKPPKPRKVMIPPSGKVSLIVSATGK